MNDKIKSFKEHSKKMEKEMNSKEMSEIFMKNINQRVNELFEKINKEISPKKIENEEIFGQEWVKSLQAAVDIVVDNATKK